MSDQEKQSPSTQDVEGQAIPYPQQGETADHTEGHGVRLQPGYAEQDETADHTEGHKMSRSGYSEQDESDDEPRDTGGYASRQD